MIRQNITIEQFLFLDERMRARLFNLVYATLTYEYCEIIDEDIWIRNTRGTYTTVIALVAKLTIGKIIELLGDEIGVLHNIIFENGAYWNVLLLDLEENEPYEFHSTVLCDALFDALVYKLGRE